MKTSLKTVLQPITLALAIFLAPAGAHADGFLDDDLFYSLPSDIRIGGDVFVQGHRNQAATHITIPSTVMYEYADGKDDNGNTIVRHSTWRVIGIAFGAFNWYTNLTSVSIPNSVTQIGGEAFSWCTNLTSVTIPDSVTVIGQNAFSDCTGLTRVTIGDGVTDIGIEAFSGCSGLTSVTISDSVIHIGGGAFEDCSGLTSVTIPDNVIYIGGGTFSGCYGLTRVTIGDSVTCIDYAVFSNCCSLTHVTIPDSVTSIGREAFTYCSGLTSVTIPDSVKNIWYGAFYNCSGLTSVTIGNSVTNIGASAFYNCRGLTSVTIPDSVKNIGSEAFTCCSSLTNVTIGNSVTNIGSEAFEDCSGLTSVTIGNSVKCIDPYAFANCRGLTSVTIPDSVKNIGFGAFCQCSGLTNVTFEGAPPSVYRPRRTPQVFEDVAPGARGYYTAEHAYEWKAVLGGGQYWEGLIMGEVEQPVLAPPELRVDSANPAEGSLTLAWVEPTTVEGVTYSVYRSANDTYASTDLVTDGLTETTWTDTDYWAAEPVLKPLNYWVVADGGDYGKRVSEPVETRRRFGVFLGLAEYDPKFNKERIQNLNEAMKLRELFVERGGMESSRAKLLRNSEANWENVKNELQAKAAETQPGDLFVLYIPTHGVYTDGEAKVMFYDCITNMIAIFKVLEVFDSETIVIPIFKACHSGAFVDYAIGTPDTSETEKVFDETSEWFKKFVEAGLAMCRGNMPILASCGAEERTLGVVTESSYTDFGEAFIHQGWENGYADGKLQGVGYAGGDGDGYVSFLELIQYAQAFARGHSDTLRSHVKWTEEHEQLLRSTLAGRAGTGSQSVPSAPDKIEATEGLFDLKIVVSWSGVANATRYWVYILKDGRTGEDDEDWECLSYWAKSTAGGHMGTLLGKSYLYRVRAVNGAGASGFSPVARGSRGTGTLIDWVKEKGVQLGLSMAVELLATTPSANGVSLEGCYVSGIDPLDPHAAFTTELVREDGKWKAKPKGGEKEGRVYRVEGKKEMSDEDWTDVTDVEDLEAEGWRFFRVGVELAE